MARSTTTSSCARLDQLALRHGQRLRAAAAPVAARRHRLRRAPARHVRHRAAGPRGAAGGAGARSVRHQAAVLPRRSPGGIAFASRAAGADRRRAGQRRAARRGAGRAAAAAIHHRRRDHLRGHQPGAAGRDDRRAPTGASSSAAAAPRCRRAGRKHHRRGRAGPAGSRRWRKASRCTSARTCPTACSSRAASTVDGRAGDDGAAERAPGQGLHRRL